MLSWTNISSPPIDTLCYRASSILGANPNFAAQEFTCRLRLLHSARHPSFGDLNQFNGEGLPEFKSSAPTRSSAWFSA